jgi:hypothetical protein
LLKTADDIAERTTPIKVNQVVRWKTFSGSARWEPVRVVTPTRKIIPGLKRVRKSFHLRFPLREEREERMLSPSGGTK